MTLLVKFIYGFIAFWLFINNSGFVSHVLFPCCVKFLVKFKGLKM